VASNGYPAIASHLFPQHLQIHPTWPSTASTTIHQTPNKDPTLPVFMATPAGPYLSNGQVLERSFPPPFSTSPQLTPAALPSLSASATSSTIPTTSSVSMSQPSSLFVPPFPFPQIWRDMCADTWAQSLMPTPQHNNPPSIYGMRPDRRLA